MLNRFRYLVTFLFLWGVFLITPSAVLANTLNVDTTTNTNVITISVDNKYKVDFYKNSANYYALFYDKAENNNTPNKTFSIIGPQIKEAGVVYRIDYDTQRRTSLIESTPTRVKVRVKGKFSQSSSLTYLKDNAGTDDIELIEDYVFTPEGFNIYQQWDFKNGLGLDDTSDIENGLSWLYLQFGETTGSHSDTIYYGNTSSESSLSITGSFANTNTYFVDQGNSTYQDYYVGIGDSGWLDFSGTGTSDYYYYPNVLNDLDLVRIREMNDTISGKHYSNWYLRFFSQADIDTTAKRQSVSDDLRNADSLADGLTKGSGWDFTMEGTNVSTNDYFNQYENTYMLSADINSQIEYSLDGDVYTRHKPYLKYRAYKKTTLPTPLTLNHATMTSGTDYNINFKPFSNAYFDQDVYFYAPLQSTTIDIGSGSLSNGGCTFTSGLFGYGAQCSANGDDLNFDPSSNIDYQKGAISFWMQPLSASTDNTTRTYLNAVSGADQFLFQKNSTNDLVFKIADGTNTFSETINSADYSWDAKDWVNLKLIWDDTEVAANQQKIFINGVEPNHTDSSGDLDGTLVNPGTTMYLGNDSATGTTQCNCVLDEFSIYNYNGTGLTSSSQSLASGGNTSSSSEYLNDSTNNFTFDFNPVNASKQGEYFYLGSDTQFSGVNLDLATLGVESSSVTIVWQYWNGTAWQNLAVTDTDSGASKFTSSGNFYFSVPTSWSKYSVHNSPQLYFLRAYLSGGAYSTRPIENKVLPDIILLQYLNNISTANQTFDLPLLIPSLSFSVSGVGVSTLTNGITTNTSSTYKLVNFGHLTSGSTKYAAHQLSVTTNTYSGYTVYVKLSNYLQGAYPGNNIDPFAASGVTWSAPIAWASPTGTSPNVDTGWIGANTSDTRVSGWSNGSAKFGPIDTNNVPVMYSSGADTGTDVYVTYALEVNSYQPADLYSGTLMYTILPKY